MPSPKQVKKYYYINNSKQRVTVSISNQEQGVIATTTVEHISTDSCGYTTAVHAVFKDFCKRFKIAIKILQIRYFGQKNPQPKSIESNQKNQKGYWYFKITAGRDLMGVKSE